MNPTQRLKRIVNHDRAAIAADKAERAFKQAIATLGDYFYPAYVKLGNAHDALGRAYVELQRNEHDQ